MHPLGLGKTNSLDINAPTYRVDMNDTAGEVIFLKYPPRATSQTVTSTVSNALVNPADLTSSCSKEESQTAAVDASAPVIWPVFEGQPRRKLDVEDSAHYSSGNAGTGVAYCRGGGSAQGLSSCSEPGLALHMAMYSVADRSFASKRKFMEDRRLISMQGNVYVPMQSRVALQIPKAWKHQVRHWLDQFLLSEGSWKTCDSVQSSSAK